MSFLAHGARVAKAGDLAILYMSPTNLAPIVLADGGIIHNRFGRFYHTQFLGQAYGSRIRSSDNLGFVYLLAPTPELWTLALPHRTQILYNTDISFITSQLELKPGSVVIETGTGSGSFTHALARTVAPHGHVYTYEYHSERQKKAQIEFEQHGLRHVVTSTHADAYLDGFHVKAQADAVFLDLPAPWDAVSHAVAALNPARVTRLCSFSPCIEQIIQTVAALEAHGFAQIRMFEVLVREYEVRHVQVQLPGCYAGNKKEARLRARAKTAASRLAAAASATTASSDDGAETTTDGATASPMSADATPSAKRVKLANGTAVPSIRQEAVTDADADADDVPSGPRTVASFRPAAEARGHTSYLLFATLYPERYRPSAAEIAAVAAQRAADAAEVQSAEREAADVEKAAQDAIAAVHAAAATSPPPVVTASSAR